MSNEPSITFEDLEIALLWASSPGPFDSSALISKATGQMFYSSSTFDTEDELPEDIDDPSLYWSVPHKNDLNLGRDLALDFTAEFLPDEEDEVRDYFRRRGAYGRFKELLELNGHLEHWYEYEREATKRALLEWADEEGLRVTDVSAN